MIRPADSDADIHGWCDVWTAITPREPISPDVVKRRLERQPERLYLVAEEDGEIVGAGVTGPTDSPGRTFVIARVLPDWRRRGIGSELYERNLAHALEQSPEWISTLVSNADPDSLAWASRRGYEEWARQVELLLTLHGDEKPPRPLDGIEIVEVTEDLHDDAYAIAQEAWRDLPTPTPMEAPPYGEWLEEELPGPIAFAAIEDGTMVGFASLLERATPDLLEHGLTATRRTHRRRGIATALKRTEVAWAAANGYRELITFTQDRNEGMQAINLALGYQPQPAWISMRRRP